MKKVGRKRALSPERTQELRAKAALYARVKRECGPAALCRDYGISLTSLRTYTRGLHKYDGNVTQAPAELTAAQIDTLLTNTAHVVNDRPTEAAESEAEAVATETVTPEAAVG